MNKNNTTNDIPQVARITEQYNKGLLTKEEYTTLLNMYLSNKDYPPFDVPLGPIVKGDIVYSGFVVTEFSGEKEKGQINLKRGDSVLIYQKYPSGWCSGENGKLIGYFPLAVVKEDEIAMSSRRTGTLPANFMKSEKNVQVVKGKGEKTVNGKRGSKSVPMKKKSEMKKEKKEKGKRKMSDNLQPKQGESPFPGIKVYTEKEKQTFIEQAKMRSEMSRATTGMLNRSPFTVRGGEIRAAEQVLPRGTEIKSKLDNLFPEQDTKQTRVFEPPVDAVVLYSFSGDQQKGQLNLKKGDLVKLHGNFSGGWTTGKNVLGEVGYFPTSYVRELSVSEKPPLPPSKDLDPVLKKSSIEQIRGVNNQNSASSNSVNGEIKKEPLVQTPSVSRQNVPNEVSNNNSKNNASIVNKRQSQTRTSMTEQSSITSQTDTEVVEEEENALESKCWNCGKEGEVRVDLLMCSRCKTALYCGKQCQVDHWKQHAPNCKPPEQRPKSVKGEDKFKLEQKVLEEKLQKLAQERLQQEKKENELKKEKEEQERKEREKRDFEERIRKEREGKLKRAIENQKSLRLDSIDSLTEELEKLNVLEKPSFEKRQPETIIDKIPPKNTEKIAKTPEKVVEKTPEKINEPTVVLSGVVIKDFVGDENQKQIAIKKGEFVQIYKQHDWGWSYGRCGRNVGFFPSNFVKLNSAPAAGNASGESKSSAKEDKKEFKIGDKIQAVFYEDNLWYNATVDAVTSRGTYFVTFDEYGNSQETQEAHIAARSSNNGDAPASDTSYSPGTSSSPNPSSPRGLEPIKLFETPPRTDAANTKLTIPTIKLPSVKTPSPKNTSPKNPSTLSPPRSPKKSPNKSPNALLSPNLLSPRNERDTNGLTPLYLATAIKDFEGNSERKRISLKKGEPVTVYKEFAAKGWAFGECMKQRGLFPLSFIIKKNDALTPRFTPEPEKLKPYDAVKFTKEGDINGLAKMFRAGFDPSYSAVKTGDTLLMIAAFFKHPDAVEFIAQKGGNVNMKNNRGQTVLHILVSKQLIETAALLIRDFGADANVEDNQMMTAIDLASANDKTVLKTAQKNAVLVTGTLSPTGMLSPRRTSPFGSLGRNSAAIKQQALAGQKKRVNASDLIKKEDTTSASTQPAFTVTSKGLKIYLPNGSFKTINATATTRASNICTDVASALGVRDAANQIRLYSVVKEKEEKLGDAVLVLNIANAWPLIINSNSTVPACRFLVKVDEKAEENVKRAFR